jgi:hypothetical protein
MPKVLPHSTVRFRSAWLRGGSRLATLYLLDLKFLLCLDTLAAGALALLSDGRIAHLNVGHVSRCAARTAKARYGWFR